VSFFEILRFAVRGMTANKLRSALTMLGVLIGVGAVILLVAVGNGSAKQITDGSAGRPDGGSDDDGLAGEIAAAARRRWWNKWTVYLGAAALLLAGFLGGVEVQKSYGDPGTGGQAGAGTGQGGPGGFQGGGPGGGGPGGGGPGGQAGPAGTAGPAAGGGGADTTTGTVKLVDGTTLYLQTADGTVVTVRTGEETAISIAKDGSLKDLKAGDPVTVAGANSAGTVTATTITGQPK